MDLDPQLREFLRPLHVDLDTVHKLSEAFYFNFADLAAHDHQQFLPTPISESILTPVSKIGGGRHLAIDIGGTNLRVGFIELSGQDALPPPPGAAAPTTPQVIRHKERSWPIAEHLKTLNTDDLSSWVGECIASVVADGCRSWNLSPTAEIPLGITFSFPMMQRSLSEATIMAVSKGFAMQGNLDLGPLLLKGYEKARRSQKHHFSQPLPPVRIVAIANDSVSTLVSFLYLHGGGSCSDSGIPPNLQIQKRPCMGLIVGTGFNATAHLRLGLLHESKRPPVVSLLPGESLGHARIAVNTEWSIRGTAPPLRRLGLVSRWDRALDAAGETPGFQPLEYMTAGRYLGELVRLVLREYLEGVLGLRPETFPAALGVRFGVSTTFLSHFGPPEARDGAGVAGLAAALEREIPTDGERGGGVASTIGAAGSAPSSPSKPGTTSGSTSAPSSPSKPSPGAESSQSFTWTPRIATAVYHIAKAIEVRAAGIVAAAIVALLKLGEDIPDVNDNNNNNSPVRELGVGYTGGCIAHFQDYAEDAQRFLDDLMKLEFGKTQAQDPLIRVVLHPCRDGGIQGAGILAAAALSSQDRKV